MDHRKEESKESSWLESGKERCQDLEGKKNDRIVRKRWSKGGENCDCPATLLLRTLGQGISPVVPKIQTCPSRWLRRTRTVEENERNEWTKRHPRNSERLTTTHREQVGQNCLQVKFKNIDIYKNIDIRYNIAFDMPTTTIHHALFWLETELYPPPHYVSLR